MDEVVFFRFFKSLVESWIRLNMSWICLNESQTRLRTSWTRTSNPSSIRLDTSETNLRRPILYEDES